MSCNHLITVTLDQGWEDAELEYLRLSQVKKKVDSHFNYCPNCGVELAMALEARYEEIEEKERKENAAKLAVEEITAIKKKEKTEEIKKKLVDMGLNPEDTSENYRIELNNKHVFWTFPSLIRFLLEGNMLNTLEVYELPSLEQIEATMLTNGYEKRLSKAFWYEWKKGNRGVTIDRFDVFTGILPQGETGINVYNFTNRTNLSTSGKNLKEVLGFTLDMKKLA